MYDNAGLGAFGEAGPATAVVQVQGTPRLRLSWTPCPQLAGSYFFCVFAMQQYPPYDYAATVRRMAGVDCVPVVQGDCEYVRVIF